MVFMIFLLAAYIYCEYDLRWHAAPPRRWTSFLHSITIAGTTAAGAVAKLQFVCTSGGFYAFYRRFCG